jgi:hypothetical protein
VFGVFPLLSVSLPEGNVAMENGPVTNDVLRKSSENSDVATSQTVSLPEDNHHPGVYPAIKHDKPL